MSSLLRPPMTTQMDALFSYDIESYQEFLLCFSKFGLYVTYDGKRSRQSEIMWPSQVKKYVINKILHKNIQPNEIRAYMPPKTEINAEPSPILIVYCDNRNI